MTMAYPDDANGRVLRGMTTATPAAGERVVRGAERDRGGTVDVDLGWLAGRALPEVVRLGPRVWRFGFGPDAHVRSECPWRVIRGGGVALGSEDHGQQYGLPAPLDAEAECRALIGGAEVRTAQVREESRDLVLGFGPGLRLELIPLSSGYESWQVAGPRRLHIVAMGGGELAVWGPDAGPAVAPDRRPPNG